jgi:8-oxo-dGTP pyrophosphatase MutT (NUDIX family)
MKSGYQFCNNCGKNGHIFQQCINPIISNGVVACRKKISNNEWQFLTICRKNTLGYIDFLRGKYPLYNRQYIQDLINEMSIEEKRNICDKTFPILWDRLWGDYVGLQYRGEEKNSKEKFNQIKKGIAVTKDDKYDLVGLVNSSTTNWSEPEWGFPKGRRNHGENDMNCGLREWEEETGISKHSLLLIKNVSPFNEVFIGSNYKSYMSRYFLALIKDGNVNINNYQSSEVSDMQWLTLEECKNKFRPYNPEKLEIIKNINNVLNKYSLIS